MTATDPAADRIDAFLADHGRGRLFVVSKPSTKESRDMCF